MFKSKKLMSKTNAFDCNIAKNYRDMQIIGNKKTRPSKVSEGYLYLSKSFLS